MPSTFDVWLFDAFLFGDFLLNSSLFDVFLFVASLLDAFLYDTPLLNTFLFDAFHVRWLPRLMSIGLKPSMFDAFSVLPSVRFLSSNH